MKFRCKFKCRGFERRQELVRHYLHHLKCKRPCPTCVTTFPTANVYIKHKCFCWNACT
ncbi:hypothetical protein B0O99DRAFT_615436 [Bisporella sp. PMI_857]|nr:hypothetical protein B0O99DRAFT_615436 [Bisporella sp. PMI_857]